MSHSDHAAFAARLLEQADLAQQSTRRITAPSREDNSSLSSVDEETEANSPPKQVPYKEQFILAQRALVSSQEASRMRYEKLEREMEELKKIHENDAIAIEKFEITVKQLNMEMADATDEVDKQISLKRMAAEEIHKLKEELEIMTRKKEESDMKVRKLMERNRILKGKLKNGIHQNQINLREEYDNQNTKNKIQDDDGDVTMVNSSLFWV